MNRLDHICFRLKSASSFFNSTSAAHCFKCDFDDDTAINNDYLVLCFCATP